MVYPSATYIGPSARTLETPSHKLVQSWAISLSSNYALPNAISFGCNSPHMSSHIPKFDGYLAVAGHGTRVLGHG